MSDMESTPSEPVERVGISLDGASLSIQLRGERFEGGRIPLSALPTLSKMNKMVASISKDLDLGMRDGAVRSSPYAKVELALVGEIEEGSAIFRLLIAPTLLAISPGSVDTQTAVLSAIGDAVPAVVQAVHEGGDAPFPVSTTTLKLAAEFAQDLGANEELVLRSLPQAGDSLEESSAVSVTLASTNTARKANAISEQRSFFVSGTLRHLENRGDEPGALTRYPVHR